MEQNTFLKISLVYWITIGIALTNLFYSSKYKEILTKDEKVNFVLVCFCIYILGSVLYFVSKKEWANKVSVVAANLPITYFESKVQYYVVSIVALILFSFLYFSNLGGFANAAVYFLWIALAAVVFVVFFPSSTITLETKGISYKKAWKSFTANWTDIKGIHANPAPSVYAATFHNMRSTSFLIETSKGVTGYIDSATIKIKGRYSPFASNGDQLIRQLTEMSKVKLTVGTYSELRDSKDKKLNWIIVLILLILITVSFYYATNT